MIRKGIVDGWSGNCLEEDEEEDDDE